MHPPAKKTTTRARFLLQYLKRKEIAMPITLSPYNHYIFIASIALVIVFLVLLALKAVDLLKAVKEKQPVLDNIQRNVTLMQIKTEAMNEKKAEDAAKNKYFKIALPILLAIYQTYRKNPQMQGPKGFVEASKEYFNKQKSEKDLAKRIKSLI